MNVFGHYPNHPTVVKHVPLIMAEVTVHSVNHVRALRLAELIAEFRALQHGIAEVFYSESLKDMYA